MLLSQSVAGVTAVYESLVDDLAELDAELADIEATEAAKKVELRERKEELASRIRRAHEAGRTSMLETLLSGASFTDMLVERTSELDAAEQDKALAVQIAKDRETLMALHATVEATRAHTDTVRQETGVQKQRLDQRLEELREAEARPKKLERAAEKALEAQRTRFDQMAKDEARLREALAAAAAATRKLQSKIDRLVARQYNQGRIPSKYNGTLRWPMPGTVTQPFGCTVFPWEGPRGDCAHFHEGIDIVAAYGTSIRASGNGRVVYKLLEGLRCHDAPRHVL